MTILEIRNRWSTKTFFKQCFRRTKNVAVVGLASRILQVGPRGSKFLGPVLIEVPHVASLCNDDREVVVLRCDSASKGKWTEHVQEKLDDKTLKVQKIQMIFFSSSDFSE